jgi:hypothetical protein
MAVMSGISGSPDKARVWSRAAPVKAALIDIDRVVTYAELERRSNRIANRLVPTDIRPGAHVGYWRRTPRHSSRSGLVEIIGHPLYDQLRVEAMWGTVMS